MKARVSDIIAIMEQHFPVSLAEKWDNVGLQIGDPNQVVTRLLVALDLDHTIMEIALQEQADMIITHHPLLFKPVKNLDYTQPKIDLIKRLVKADISVYSAHTNLDSAPAGLNQYLAEKLGLTNIQPLFPAINEELYKIAVFVPASHLEEVRDAMSGAGAGHIGNYSECTFSQRGTGTFRPGENTSPYIGKTGQLETVEEYRLETAAYKNRVPAILAAMRKAHPYEEVAFDLYRLENPGLSYCPGRSGMLAHKRRLDDYAAAIKEILELDHLRMTGDPGREVQNIAVISGAGASFIEICIKQGVEVLVTGDVKYHEAIDARAAGMAVIDAGHQGTEQIVVSLLNDLLMRQCRESNFEVTIVPANNRPCFLSI